MIMIYLYALLFCLDWTEQNFTNLAHDKAEKVYLHTDRTLYFPEETIWYKAYVLSSDLELSSISDILYVELIGPNGSVVDQQVLKLDLGRGNGDFLLKENYAGGTYNLRAYTNWMKNMEGPFYFEKEITIHKIRKPNLLLKMDLDQDSYSPGDSISGAFTCNRLDNKPQRYKSILVSLVVDGKTTHSKTYVTDSSGKVMIKEFLPKVEMNSAYLSVVATKDGAKETIVKALNIVSKDIDIQFLAEGGTWIAGAAHKIAFIAKDRYGKPVTVSGYVVSDEGMRVCSFDSFHDGMGSFTLDADEDRSYFARITRPVLDSTIALPEIQSVGHMMTVIENNSKEVKVLIEGYQKDRLQLDMQMAEEVIYSNEVVMKESDFDVESSLYSKLVRIRTSDFHRGISQIKISSVTGNCIAERLIFINYHKGLKVSFTMDKNEYNSREKVNLEVYTTDHNGEPVAADLSLGVIDYSLDSYADDKQGDIQGSMLLTSELKGEIHEPSYYFNDTIEQRELGLDYVMLTHGWRSYLNNNGYEITEHDAQRLSLCRLQTVDYKNNPLPSNLIVFNNRENQAEMFKTDEFGIFTYPLGDRSSKYFIAYTDTNIPIRINMNYRGRRSNYETIKKVNKYRRNVMNKDLPASKYPKKKTIMGVSKISDINLQEGDLLSESVVVGYKVPYEPLIQYNPALQGARSDNLNNMVDRLEGQMVGVSISNPEQTSINSTSISIEGMSMISGINNPMYIVDGIPYDAGHVRSLLLSTKEVSQVSVLQIADTYNVGYSHVVIIDSKGISLYGNKGLRFDLSESLNYACNYINRGYGNHYRPKVFYAPKYDAASSDKYERSDFRNTIYWNPTIQTDKDGKASLSFYNSDAISSFQIKAEGVGANSTVGSSSSLYYTKDEVHTKLLLPPYLVIGDTLEVSSIIANNGIDTLNISSKLELTKNIEIIEHPDHQNILLPELSITLSTKIAPKESGNNLHINLLTEYDSFEETVAHKIDVLDPYFPYEASFSSHKPQSYTFDIGKRISGSTQSSLTFYKDIIGSVMDGVEAMIRKPSGCFEQTSSKTYPNIMVLKYLREVGKSNRDIESKALHYIEKGYDRLITFQVKGGGFGWFGRRAHKSLTAFGILQFVEMAQVYDGVDPNIVEKTVEWIMDQRDGKGGFHKGRKANRYSQSAFDVANAYIVYALSEAKVDKDYKLEFDRAVQDAIESKDPYKVAIMALASDNLNAGVQYEQLVSILVELIQDIGFENFEAAQTITRSYGGSNRLETAAFAVMALLRGQHAGYARQGVEYLLSQRNHGRFGSTQATCMTLKALLEYNRRFKMDGLRRHDITLHINDKLVNKKWLKNENNNYYMSDLEEYLDQGQNHVVVNWQGSSEYAYDFVSTWKSDLPCSNENVKVNLNTRLSNDKVEVGEVITLDMELVNITSDSLPMVTAVIGIPGGVTLDHKLLKNLAEKGKYDYFEIFDNSLVLYWTEMDPEETIEIAIPLIADIKGVYNAPASHAYLYYTDEDKHWVSGENIRIK